MFIILGATGHVGSAAAAALLEARQPVTAVIRDAAKAPQWRARGAAVAVVDVRDTDALRMVFRSGRRAFLLNPPAATSGDTDREEHETLRSIVAALHGSGLEKVVVESTYGAQPGHHCGDLSVLYDFEQALAAQPIPTTVLRAAYYMSNWNVLLGAARDGTLPTMYPPGLKIPMVAPADLGRAAARLLQASAGENGIHYVEGPDRYSAQDAADAFAEALHKPVKLSVTPRERWDEAYRKLGFSAEAAASYSRMTAVSVDGGFDMPDAPERGRITLSTYIRDLAAAAFPGSGNDGGDA